MPDIPFTVFLGPILVVVVLVAMPFLRRAYMGRADRQFADLRVGNLAQRLGLRVVEGDPALNMIQAHTAHTYKRADPVGGFISGFRGVAEKHTHVHLRGVVRGHPVEFVFAVKTDIVDTESTEWFTCELTVPVPGGVPAFEVLMRSQSKHWGARPKLGLPAQSLGDRDLDAAIVFLCADPALGRALAPALAGLRRHNFVHLTCVRGLLSALGTREGLAMVAHQLPETQAVLLDVADVLTGAGRR